MKKSNNKETQQYNLHDVSVNEAICKYKKSCGHHPCNLTECDEFEQEESEVTVCLACKKNPPYKNYWICKQCKEDYNRARQTER